MHMGHAEDEGMDMGHAEDEGMDLEDEAMEDEMADLYESLSSLFEAEEDEGDEPIEPTGGEEDEEAEDAGGMPEAEGEMEGLKPEIVGIKSELDQIKDMLQQLMSSQGGEAGPPPGAEMAPAEEPAPAPSPESMPPGAAPGPSERVYRVDENALLRELRSLRESKSAQGTVYTDKAKKPTLAGKPLPEAYAEDEEMELDEMMDEPEGESTDEGKTLGKMPAHTKGHGAGKSAPFTEKAKVMKENRDLKVSLAKHAEAIESLRGQLTEMNLFNAKLLYVNRLLQDRELSDAQRRNIIESLDRARSLREVKLLYKGLSESIGRKTSAKRPELVSESVGSRAVSPTSRPLSTSGVRLNEAVEVHRWAVLAGIGSKS
jgi:hypothetical protein